MLFRMHAARRRAVTAGSAGEPIKTTHASFFAAVPDIAEAEQ